MEQSCEVCVTVLYSKFYQGFMESSTQPPGNPSKPRPYRVADVVGTLIAIMTLLLPTLFISYYSGYSSAAPPGAYSSDRVTPP
jgi:hypothetical protein